MTKGPISADYQVMTVNFIIFWYFFSNFITTSFALLYYRKFR